MSTVSVILVAGGTGSRMQAAIPKQYLQLSGKPIAQYSFDILRKQPEVKEVIVVCDPAYRSLFPGATFAMPGKRRQDSVFNGLQKVSQDSEFICIHDAARPFIQDVFFKEVLQAAKEYDAAVIGTPVKFTVKEADAEGLVKHTLNRDHIWEIQTPQMIRASLLKEGFDYVNRHQLTVTDDVLIVELLGKPVKLVRGDYRNLKITTPEDLVIAQSILDAGFHES